MDEREGKMVIMFPVHDGFVRLVDAMGDDMAVVKAARVSYGNESKGKRSRPKIDSLFDETQSRNSF